MYKSHFITILSLFMLSLAASAQAPAGIPVFVKGEGGVDTFRIPAIIRTKTGTLLAFAEARWGSASDTGDIDLVVKRSTDGGKTWGEMITVWDDGSNTCGNPCPVVDRRTGRIVLLSTWNDGRDHEPAIHARTSIDTRRVFRLFSDDDGKTWSKAEEITSQAKLPEWTWYATGPCHALQLGLGRIVAPCNHGNFGRESTSHVIYSDDAGQTWHIGGETFAGNESTVAALPGGRMMINMRKTKPERATFGPGRLAAVSEDGALSFGTPYYEEALIEPVCQGSIINSSVRRPSKTLIFSNPEHPSARENLTLRMSRDEGRSWRRVFTVTKGPAAYSDLVVLDKGDVGVLYEAGKENPYEGIFFSHVGSRTVRSNWKRAETL